MQSKNQPAIRLAQQGFPVEDDTAGRPCDNSDCAWAGDSVLAGASTTGAPLWLPCGLTAGAWVVTNSYRGTPWLAARERYRTYGQSDMLKTRHS